MTDIDPSTATKPRAKFTAHTDIRLRYLEWEAESEGDGAPVVLLHGLTVSAEYWSPTARLLAREHRVLAVDLRGHGHSDKPDWGYDYPTLARDVEQLCEEAGVTGALVAGHSWGAGVALCLAVSRPDLVSRLAMVDGGFGGRRPRGSSDGAPPDYEAMMAPPGIYRSRETYLQAAGASLSQVTGPEIEAILMASVTVNPDGSISERLSRENHVRILQQMGDLNARDLYQSLRTPVLFAGALSAHLRGQEWNDRKRESVRRAQELVADSRVQWFPDTAHDIQIHRPQELAQALEEFIHG